MKKYLLILILGLVVSLETKAQIFKLKSLPASGVIFRKEGGSSINIDILNTMAMPHNMAVKYTFLGKNSGAVVSTDLTGITAASDTINFSANDTTRRFSFRPVLDNVAEGNDTFVFKLTQAVTMGSIGTPDSIIIVITDSVAPPITGRPLYDIGKIRGNNTGGVPDSLGITCTVRGVLYGNNIKNPGYQMSICDGTGCMGIFSAKTYAIYSTAAEGDSVEVSGYVDEFRGLGQMKFSSTGDTIRLLGSKTVKAAEVVTTLNEYSESRLVKMDNLVLSSGTWIADSNFDIKMKNASGTEFTIHVNNKTNYFSSPALIVSGKKYSITGLGGQFDVAASTPKTTSYQLVPRKASDIVMTGNSVGINSANSNDELSVYPTVTNQTIQVKFNGAKNEKGMIKLYNMEGKIVKTEDIAIVLGENGFSIQQLNKLPAGNYFLSIESETIVSTKSFTIVK